MTELKKVEPGDIDLQKWYEQRDSVKALCRECMNGALKGEALAVQASRLIEQTNTVIDALCNDMAGLMRAVQEGQQQQNNVGLQAYLALETLKRKGLATEEEIHEIHMDIMKENMEALREQLEVQQKEEAPEGAPSDDPVADDNVIKFPGS